MELDYATKDKLRQIVVESLTGMGGKMRNDEILIRCPFHDDRRPSLYVHVGHKLIPGTYHCFVCNSKGMWTALAKKLGLDVEHIEILKKESESNKIINPFSIFKENLKEMELAASQTNSIEEPRGLESLEDEFTWRGLNKKTLEKVEARLLWQKKSASYWLYLPLKMNKKLEGYTLCALKKEPNAPKYLLFGEAGKILFPFDAVENNKNICLVEGHYDALRLVSLGINAMCIFGVNNWSESKKSSLLSKSPKKIYILMDGDDPGRAAALKIYNELKFGTPVEIVNLPDPPQETERYDPGNMPIEWIDSLRRHLA
jgi:hypothetical protein